MQKFDYRKILLILLTIVGPLSAQNWLQWGGPDRNFIITETAIAEAWPATGPRLLWERDLGDGNSGIVISDGIAVTLYRSFDGQSAIGDEEIVLAVNAENGATLWEHRYNAPGFKDRGYNGEKGPHASPLIAGDMVYTLGYTGVFSALNLKSGKLQWSTDFLKDFAADTLFFGNSTSPLALNGNIIVPVFSGDAGMVAFDAATGNVAWKSERIKESYGSPVIMKNGNTMTIVMTGQEYIFGISPEDGTVIWKQPYDRPGMNNIPSAIPLPDAHLLIATLGFQGAVLFQLRGNPAELQQKWANNKITFAMGTQIVDGDIIYGSNQRLLYAFNWRNGEILWRQRGFSDAKIVQTANRSLLLDDKGNMTLASLTPEGVEAHSRFTISETRTWTAPTLIGDKMYFRDRLKMKAFDLSPAANAVGSTTAAVSFDQRTQIEQMFLDGDAETAMTALRTYGESNPDSINDNWIQELGSLLYSQDLTDAAGSVFTDYIERQPQSVVAYRGMREFFKRKEMTADIEKLDARFLMPVRFEVAVPANTPDDAKVYLAGNAEALGRWSPAGVELSRLENGNYSGEVKLPRGATVQYKLTRGNWDTVETDSEKANIDNRQLEVAEDNAAVSLSVVRWADL